MPQRYCEVALPVPLHSTFTYAVPASFDGQSLVGRRMVVPFGKRAMVGVGIAESHRPPDVAQIKEIAELMDPLPALPPNLIELGHWISRYYLAPIGEAFRATLPPEIELRHNRAFSLTDLGRTYLRELAATKKIVGFENDELDLLRLFDKENPSLTSRARRWPGGEATAEKLLRRGYLAARDVVSPRKTRTHKIVAWNPNPPNETSAANRRAKSSPPAREAEARIREVLASTRGPLPLPLLLAKANASRNAVQRLEKAGALLTWDEPRTPGEDP
ncbi:MAG TPA: hypothetical protein VI216_14335, partial [Candidatus Acidoferrales bacterium]